MKNTYPTSRFGDRRKLSPLTASEVGGEKSSTLQKNNVK